MSVSCPICLDEVTATMGVSCCTCKRVFHPTCVNMRSQDVEVVNESRNWQCSDCLQNTRKTRSHSASSKSTAQSAGLKSLSQPATSKSSVLVTNTDSTMSQNQISRIFSELDAVRKTQQSLVDDLVTIKNSQADLALEVERRFDRLQNTLVSKLDEHRESIFGHFAVEFESFKKQLVDSVSETLGNCMSGLPLLLNPQVQSGSIQDVRMSGAVATGSSSSGGAPSFARVAASRSSVVIKPKDVKQSNAATKAELLQQINPVASGVSISRVKHIRDGGLVIGCPSGESASKLRDMASEKLASKYVVRETKPVHPRIKIVGMTEEHESGSLLSFLSTQNPSVFPAVSELEVVSFGSVKRRNVQDGSRRGRLFQSVIKVSSETYKRALSVGQVFVGYDCCSVYDAVDVLRCYNCSGFNHTATACKSKRACPKCAGDHLIADCLSVTFKCVNCQNFSGGSPNAASDFAHAAWDRRCKIYQHRLKSYKLDVLGLE